MSFVPTPSMSRAAVEARRAHARVVGAEAASSFGSNFWGQKMIENPVLIYVAQWSGSLAVLSAAAFISFLSGNLDRASVPERERVANDRPVAVAQGYACASGAGGATMGIHYVTKASPHGAFADMNPNVGCEHSSSERH
jgi:hypothetical protein